MADESDAAIVTIDRIQYSLNGTATVVNIDSSITEVTIPSTVSNAGTTYDVTKIDNQAFDGKSITKVTIGNNVTSIGTNAFQNCTSLTTAVLSENLKTIDGSAFSGCKKLTSIIIPNTVTSIGTSAFENCEELKSVTFEEGSTLESIGITSFCGCKALESITIPNTVTSIGASAFHSCTALETVIVSNNVSTIPNYMFYGCTDLSNLTLGTKVESFGNDPFHGCDNNNITVTVLCPTWDSMFYQSKFLSGLVIGNGIDEIKSKAFYGCTKLKSVTFSDNSLTSIGEQAFQGCTSLSSINLDDASGLTTIRQYAFAGCHALGSITAKPVNIPNTVRTIETYAFYQCKALKSVTIPASVETIEQYTFAWCDSLGKVEISSGVKNIKYYAFGDSKIKHISIPSSVVDINSNAFYGIKFYDTDEMTELASAAGSLAGFTFKGDSCEKLIKQAVAVSHSVRYDANGGSATAPDEISVQEGQNFTIEGYEGTKSGFTFGGWSYGGQTYQPGETVTMGTSNIVLTAVWTSITAHSVTYDPNGGTGYTPVQTDVEEGVAFQVQGYTGTKDGFTFGGWSYNGKTYQSGDMITMGGSAIVLTAVWNQTYVPVPDTDDDELPFYPVAPVQPVEEDDTTKTIAVVIAACAAALLAMMFLALDRRS